MYVQSCVLKMFGKIFNTATIQSLTKRRELRWVVGKESESLGRCPSTWCACAAPSIPSGRSFSIFSTIYLIRHNVADPHPGSGVFLTPGSGMGQKSGSGSGIRIRDEKPGSYFRELRNHFLGQNT